MRLALAGWSATGAVWRNQSGDDGVENDDRFDCCLDSEPGC